jgi:hypothetical protein
MMEDDKLKAAEITKEENKKSEPSTTTSTGQTQYKATRIVSILKIPVNLQ